MDIPVKTQDVFTRMRLKIKISKEPAETGERQAIPVN
jgi:hypothetical protein